MFQELGVFLPLLVEVERVRSGQHQLQVNSGVLLDVVVDHLEHVVLARLVHYELLQLHVVHELSVVRKEYLPESLGT